MGTPWILHIKVCLKVLGSAAAYIGQINKGFCGVRGSCMRLDGLPQVVSLESAPIGSEESKLKMKMIPGLEKKEMLLPDLQIVQLISA